MMDHDRNHPTRRFLLSAAAAGAAAAGIGGSARAQDGGCRIGPAPHPKGPLVFLDYDQIELDAAYDQSVYAPLGGQIQARRTTNSEEVRRRLGTPERHAYGPKEIEKLDIFRTDRPNAPVFIFVHGGAWRSGNAKEYHFAAENITRAGAHYVAIDFYNAGEAGGDIRIMADQVKRAIVWVFKNATTFGGDPNKIYLAGQSSGAHLSGVALITDWQKDFGVPNNIVKAGLLLSGMYEMKPVRLSARSSYVKFDDAMEESMSTIRHLDRLHTPITVMYGTNETPEFQRQARDFAAAVKAKDKAVTLIVAPNHNHYELQETMASPYGWAGRTALAMMGLGKP